MIGFSRGITAGAILVTAVSAALTFALTAGAAPTPVSFAPVENLPSGGPFPDAVAIGDLNGDGKKDIAVVNSGNPSSVGVLLGTGGGGFAPASTYATGLFFPDTLAIGDLNGDGKKDIVVANVFGSVAVLLGHGDGSLAAPSIFDGATGRSSTLSGIALSDLNVDGHLDVVASDRNGDIVNGGKVSVLLGDGTGALGTVRAFPTNTEGPSGITVADFNADHRPDVAISSVYSSAFTVLLGNGDGSFGAPASYPSGGTYTYAVASGDLNHDGKPDLAAGSTLTTDPLNPFPGPVGVIFGDGNGGFGTTTKLTPSGYGASMAVAIGDLNADGVQDLASASSGALQVWPSNGDGTFGARAVFALGDGANPSGLALGDLNGDHQRDIAVAENNYNGTSGSVSVLSNTTPIESSDTTPPTITVPTDMIVEATSPGGAAVVYTVTATDDVDSDPEVECSPAPGSTFALGDTIVGCTATDFSGNSAEASFKVTVRDTTPPTITVPTDVIADATSPAGAVVTYSASASDLVDPHPTLSCSPPSGSKFPIGDTTVTCSATDFSGNSASATSDVHVEGAAEQIVDLMATVSGLEPPPPPPLEAALDRQLELALDDLQANRTDRACGDLSTFIKIVQLRTPGSPLTPQQVALLTRDAKRIEAVIGC